jgi:2-aminoadipate transaminase
MDATYLQSFLTDSARTAKRSEIREILKVIARPEVISLAGGLPSPETFPLDLLAEVIPDTLRRHGAAALQYGTTEGDDGLRDELVALMAEDGIDTTRDGILVTSASQQGLDILARVFLAPGDVVVMGLPSYLGALGAFTAAGARLRGVPIDDEGMCPDLLEELLIGLRRESIRPKLLYLVPDFQNPAGVTISRERRRELLTIAAEFDLLVVEDSPYRLLRYTGTQEPPVQAMARDGRVVSLFTFSKILFPGLRLGWMVGDPEVIARCTVAKQPMDLCTSSLVQVIARELLHRCFLPPQLERTREIYARKRVAMLAALDELIDPAWGVRWTRPEGGLFLWMTLPAGYDSRKLLELALERNVAFVTGSAFYCDGGGANTLRLNFSYPSVEMLRVAIERLADAMRTLLATEPTVERERVWRPESRQPSDGRGLEQLAWSMLVSEVTT